MPPELQFTATLGECIGCGRRGLLNERRHCCDCLDAAMNKADALDSLDLAVQKCLEADLTEKEAGARPTLPREEAGAGPAGISGAKASPGPPLP